jgi:cobyrinic acid a,c-diamide synthase
MGLYDGYGTDPNYCSSAAMAKQLGCPVILLVDGKAVSTSIAATVMGFQHFDPALNIAGVIVNRVNSDTHFQLLKSAIERYCGRRCSAMCRAWKAWRCPNGIWGW